MKRHQIEKLVIENIHEANNVSNLINILGVKSGGGINNLIKK